MFRNILISALLLAPTIAHAELHKGSLGFGYSTSSADLSAGGETLDGDINQSVFQISHFLSENIEFAASLATGTYELVGEEIDIDNTSIGFTFHSERVDLIKGTGGGFKFGVSNSDSDLTYDGISTSGAETFVELGYASGLGEGLSIEVKFIGQSDDMGGNNGISASLMSCQTNNVCLKGAVTSTSTESDGLTLEGSGFKVGIGFLF